MYISAAIAQLGERQTEDLKVPGSIPGEGTFFEDILFAGFDPHLKKVFYENKYFFYFENRVF